MSDLIKECPACGHSNAPEESFCTECDYDLLTVPVTRRGAAAPTGDRPAEVPVQPVSGGAEDSDFPRFEAPAQSPDPRADAEGARPYSSGGGMQFKLEADQQPESCRIELVEDPSFSFTVLPGQTVGRGVDADVMLGAVPHARYISRRHAQFSRRAGQWFVQYLGSGNYIKVDGQVFEDDSLAALQNGSILTLSLTSFRVILD